MLTPLMDIQPSKLFTHVIIVSFSTLGIVEWLKNFIHFNQKKHYAVLALPILTLCVTLQFALNPIQTMWFNMFTLALATMQFGHTALIKIPEIFIQRFLGKGD